MARARAVSKLIEHLAGRWSKSQPARAGVYLVRERGNAWVMYWQPDAFTPFGVAPPIEREYFHLRGDDDGAPTRWDDPRVTDLAKARGWRGQ